MLFRSLPYFWLMPIGGLPILLTNCDSQQETEVWEQQFHSKAIKVFFESEEQPEIGAYPPYQLA